MAKVRNLHFLFRRRMRGVIWLIVDLKPEITHLSKKNKALVRFESTHFEIRPNKGLSLFLRGGLF
jgi:hypothetical protein